jgi:hypothetical protein
MKYYPALHLGANLIKVKPVASHNNAINSIKKNILYWRFALELNVFVAYFFLSGKVFIL